MQKNPVKIVTSFFSRNHSLSSLVLPILKEQVSFGESCYCSSLTWDTKRNQLRFMRETKSKLYLRVYGSFAALTTLRTLGILYKTYRLLSVPKITLSYQLVMIVLFGFLFGINWIASLNFGQEEISSEACMLVNRIMEFSKRHKNIGKLINPCLAH